MGFAEDQFFEYLRRHLTLLDNIRIDELLLPLSACLTPTTVERLNTYVRNQGNRSTVLDFCLDLSRNDDWVNHFINALQYCGYGELAEKFQTEYFSHRPRSLVSPPRSLPPYLSNRNQQPSQVNPQCTSNLPGPMPPSSQDTQPGPSPKPVQPEQEMSPSSASGHNHEFRSLPPLPYDPPAPTRATLTHSVSERMQSDRRTLEDKTSKTPVPEAAQKQAAPNKDDNGASQKAANRQEQPVSPPLSRSIRETAVSEECQDARSAYPVAANRPEQPASPPPAHSIKGKEVSRVQQDAQPTQQAAGNRPEKPASPPPARSVRKKVVSDEVQNYSHSAHAANHQEQHVTPPPARSFREKSVSGVQNEAESRRHVPSGSSCRPLQNNDEDYFSKPGILNSTPGLGDDSSEVGVLSETSIHVLQISEDPERSESSNTGHRSSPTSSTQSKVPPVSAPNHRSMQVLDQRSPEENDFTFERTNTNSPNKSSPGGNRRLDQSPLKQPEENSFGSRSVRLDFSEDPDTELLEGNDDGLRNRSRKIPNLNETDDQSTEKTCSTGRDRERMVLITVTVISVCLSVFLLLKNRHN
ncbi:uncharacterized protein [Dendrobates tinctorius]|uniref:uncharacterized protein isoform X2 n=1 Tax=Dendrobates tinctorius TaxID=92724 RepID=UPI003CC93052